MEVGQSRLTLALMFKWKWESNERYEKGWRGRMRPGQEQVQTGRKRSARPAVARFGIAPPECLAPLRFDHQWQTSCRAWWRCVSGNRDRRERNRRWTQMHADWFIAAASPHGTAQLLLFTGSATDPRNAGVFKSARLVVVLCQDPPGLSGTQAL